MMVADPLIESGPITMPTKRSAKKAMSDDHKAALAQGRSEGRVVRSYLESLRANAPRRGRPRTADTIERRLATIETKLATASPVRQLQLVQERRDLHTELAAMGEPVDMAGLEASFVEVAAGYSQRHGISYASWREVGVSAAVLSRAGIGRSR